MVLGAPLDGAADGYRPTATLTFVTDLRRQAGPGRTRLTLGFMALLPLIILVAFEFGRSNGGGAARRPAPLSPPGDGTTAGGRNMAPFTQPLRASFPPP